MTNHFCGQPHYRYTESVCTEPAGHYIRVRDPHAGPLIIGGVQRGGLAWDEPEEQPVTYRIPLDAMTSDALDALYEQLEAAEETESQRQLATAREALASATTRAARAEAELAALRRVARGYCPACGRGDAAPTTADWEQQKQRADEAERQRDGINRMYLTAMGDLGIALNRLNHIRDACDQLRRASVLADGQPHTDRERGIIHAIDRITAALDPPAPAPAATPAAGHDTGPGIAECAANDRRWPLEKAGE